MPSMDHTEVVCPATPVPLPSGLEEWVRKQPVGAGDTARTATILPLGSGVTATLLPTPQITYAVHAKKPGGPASSGGMFAFTVPARGRYRVVLGSAAWIDVLRDSTLGTSGVAPPIQSPIPSVAHAHGPDCTGLRKMVDFDLMPGRYLLQVVGNSTAVLPMMVVRMP